MIRECGKTVFIIANSNKMHVQLRGDTAPLSWDKDYPISSCDSSIKEYVFRLNLPADTEKVSYKFVAYRSGYKTHMQWEELEGNRVLDLTSAPQMSVVRNAVTFA